MKRQKEITILKLPSSTPNEVAFSMCMDDKPLIDAICKVSGLMRKEGKEIFKRDKNVIATEDGFLFAIYTEDVEAVEGGDFKPENEVIS